MTMLAIHNISGVEKTYEGVPIPDGTFYPIPVHMLYEYRANAVLINDLANSLARMSADGSTDYSVDPALNVLLLLGEETKQVSVKETNPYADAQGYRVRNEGFSGVAAAGQVTNIDFKMPDERYVSGVRLNLSGQAEGDYLHFQVVDKDNIFGYGAGIVLDQFATSWFVNSDLMKQDDVSSTYWAKILANLYVRIVYHSAGLAPVNVYCNLFLHRKSV